MHLPVIAYTTPTQATAVRWATGVAPCTSPPLTSGDPAVAEILRAAGLRPHVIYLALHGYPGQPHLYGEGATALTPENLAGLAFPGSVIFAPVCHLTDSPMLGCLLATMPRAVIAAAGENWTPFVHVFGRTLIRLLRLGMRARPALRLTRARLALHSDHPGALDALALRIFMPSAAAGRTRGPACPPGRGETN